MKTETKQYPAYDDQAPIPATDGLGRYARIAHDRGASMPTYVALLGTEYAGTILDEAEAAKVEAEAKAKADADAAAHEKATDLATEAMQKLAEAANLMKGRDQAAYDAFVAAVQAVSKGAVAAHRPA